MCFHQRGENTMNIKKNNNKKDVPLTGKNKVKNKELSCRKSQKKII